MRTLAASLACLLFLAAPPSRSETGGEPASEEATEEAPPQSPEQEVRTLGDYGIAYTTRALQAGSEFYPFAFVMRRDGAIQRIAPGELPRFPTQIELLQTLEQGFADAAVKDKYRAVAIVADVVIAMPDGRESEAIQLALEHREGFCRNVFYPYTLSKEGTLNFDEPLSGKRTGKIFTACN
ncbi:MAG: hypothetical protein JRH16_07260 [Deltaproteobacteria bacterium]|nr:hypothetical protein [Deltaproteobacteria bacterium]MBW2360001.1 hypothetical protein [Deltaproteobacteria bacterium]